MTQAEYSPVSLKGKAVLVTGGTTGIGRATAALLVSCGAKVFIFGREKQPLQEALADIQTQAQEQGQIFGTNADQSKPIDVQRVFKEVDAKLGGVDILVNNAAESGDSISDTDYEEWRYVIETNLLGNMQCCRHAVDRMKAKGAGHIVNIGSMSAKSRSKGSDIYVATKSAIEGFSEALRKQVNDQGIKVSLIEPSLVGTDMTAEKTPPEHQPQKIAEGEMLKAEDLAQCVLYTLVQSQRCDVTHIQIQPHKQGAPS